MAHFSLPGLRLKRPMAVAAVLLAGSIAGCGSPSAAHLSEADAPAASTPQTETASQGFDAWCQEWQFTCTTDSAQANGAVAVDPKVRKALSTIFLELLQSPSLLSLTRADLEAGDLKSGLKSLSLDAFLGALGQKLDLVGWQKATLANSTLRLDSKGGGWLPSQSGLELGLSEASTVKFLPGDRLEIAGIKLRANVGGQTAGLLALEFPSAETLNLVLSDRRVEGVPTAFVAQLLFDVLGANDPRLEPKAPASRTESIQSFFPLLNWLNQPSRVISLSRRFFSKTADELSALPDMDASLLAILRSLDSLQTNQQSSKNGVALTQVTGSNLRCDANKGELVLAFDRSFGIKRFYQAEKGGIGFEFFGVKASSNKSFGSFPVKRIELTPESYNILDVPVLNKISLKWDDIEKEANKGTVVKTVCTL